MPRPSILNSIERKFILLVGDLLIIVASLNVFINHAIDIEFISLKLKLGVFVIGILSYLTLSYILDFFNLQKVSKRRYVLSQSIYITALFVFVVFILTVLFFDVSFWRIPLLYFLIMTPVEIALWRFLFSNVFRIIPVTKNVLYIYDDKTAENFRKDLDTINGKEIDTFYKVKLTYSVDRNTLVNKNFFLSAADKIDAWIINTKSYNYIPKDLEKMLLQSIINGKEVISFTSFYENTYEAMPIRSHNDSFYEILQIRNKKIRYLQQVFSFGINFSLAVLLGFIFILTVPFVFFLNLFF